MKKREGLISHFFDAKAVTKQSKAFIKALKQIDKEWKKLKKKLG
jgi:hypothetical protein